MHIYHAPTIISANLTKCTTRIFPGSVWILRVSALKEEFNHKFKSMNYLKDIVIFPCFIMPLRSGIRYVPLPGLLHGQLRLVGWLILRLYYRPSFWDFSFIQRKSRKTKPKGKCTCAIDLGAFKRDDSRYFLLRLCLLSKFSNIWRHTLP